MPNKKDRLDPETSQLPGRANRRRGARLEDALLDAAWDELQAVGYAKLTMEAVAARAGTSKPVLYRRWPNRALLVLAVFRRQATSIADVVPDAGDLRDDTLAVLRHLRNRQQIAGPEVIHGLLAELQDVPAGVLEILPTVMTTVLARAMERGEVRPERVTRTVAALPGNLVRHEMMVSREPVTDQFLVEVVDEVFLPLVATELYEQLQTEREASPGATRLGSYPGGQEDHS
jgi:AcrR family transcriptional regulator